MIDIVVPKANEEEFIKTARRLGMKGLVLLYKQPPKSRINETEFRIHYALFADNRDEMRQAKHFDFVVSQNHALLSDSKVSLILSPEELNARDHMHQRRSGLNETLCKDYKEKIFVISFGKILVARKKAAVLGRQQQNAMLFNKFRNKVIVASFARTPYEMRAPRDLVAYCRCLGLQRSKEAVQLLENYLK